MANETWHYLENQFDSVTRRARKRMDSILADTHPKLAQGANLNPALEPALAVLTPAKTAWDAAYGQWLDKQAGYRSATQATENLISSLQRAPAPGERSKLDRWESKVAGEWARSHPVYQFLFPRGREPFTSGTREQILDEVERLGGRFTQKAGDLAGEAAALLTGLGGEVTAFHSELQAARDAQQTTEGEVDQFAALADQRRVEAATALYRVLAKLMDIFAEPAERDQVTGFFDLTLIMTPPRPDEGDEAEPPASTSPGPTI